MPVRVARQAPRSAYGVPVADERWSPYEAMGRRFAEHAQDSAYNAHYDRPAVLAALGAVRGQKVLDAACGPGLYAATLLDAGAESWGSTPAR